MTAAGHSGPRAPILGTAYRSPARVAFDLWRARGSFRGFVEFAVIGAVVLWFLGARGAPNLEGILQGIGKATGVQTRPMPAGSTQPNSAGHTQPASAGPPASFNKNEFPLSPRLNEIRFDAQYFDSAPAPLREQLASAFDAYRDRKYQKALDLLNGADPANRLVLLMRGMSLIALRGGDTFHTGIGLLRQAADRGEPKAMAFLGLMTTNGLPGLDRNMEEGRKLLENAAKAGETDAFRVLGEGYISGWVGSVDPARAVDYLRSASDRGDVKATARLAELYFTGRGMAKDHKEAERLMAIAANTGHAESQALLGTWRLVPYMKGVTDDPSEALQWLERAVAQNEPHAMEYLGMFYVEHGKRTGLADPPRGVELFRRCVELTFHADCIFKYATALDFGMGATRDPIKAYAYYSVANSRSGSAKTSARMSDIKKLLSPDELARAEGMVREIWSKNPLRWTTGIGGKFVDCNFEDVRAGKKCE